MFDSEELAEKETLVSVEQIDLPQVYFVSPSDLSPCVTMLFKINITLDIV